MTKKVILTAALLAAGIVAVYGTYQFRSDRLTPGRLRSVDLAKERVARAERAEKVPAEKKVEAPAEKLEDSAVLSDKRPEAPVKLEEVAATPPAFDVQFHTTAGDFVINFKSEWSPLGVDRVYKLMKTGYYDDCIFFRVVPGFVVQWGIAGEPAKTQEWIKKLLPAEQPKQSNRRGTVTFGMGGSPATRSVHLFINLGDNSNLDEMGFGPVGEVVKGMEVVEKLNSKYGEATTNDQRNMVEMGNPYIDRTYPGLDRIIWTAVLKDDDAAPAPAQGK